MYKRCVSTPLPKVSLLIIRRGHPKMTSSTSNLGLIYDGMETHVHTHTQDYVIQGKMKLIESLKKDYFSFNEWDVLQ
jgi:hypothetical protein